MLPVAPDPLPSRRDAGPCHRLEDGIRPLLVLPPPRPPPPPAREVVIELSGAAMEPGEDWRW